MRTTFFRFFCYSIIVVLTLSACNLPASDATAEVVATQTAKSTSTEQVEVVPTDTPTATATETPIREPSATSIPEVPKAEVLRESNCRVGPGGAYDLVAKYQAGQLLEVVAKDLGGGYWFVKNPDQSEEQCYLLAQNIAISGDTSALPKFTPQPSPTAAPYFKLTFKKFDTCKGEDFALFTVENTGSVAFRSAYIKVTDQKVNKSVEQALNAFDLPNGCILAKNIAPLEPGATGYVQSPPFKWEARGNKLRATIMVCTDKNLKGTCVTQTLDVKP
jgi:hypothetical protein